MWLIKFWTNVLAGIAVTCTILSFAGRIWWVFALMEHPRVQYSFILLITLFVRLFTSKKRTNKFNILCLTALSINLILILPVFIPSNILLNQTLNQSLNTPEQTIRLIHATLDSKKPDVTKAVEYLNQQETDILFLLEVTPESLIQLKRGLTNYRLIGAQPKYTSHGIALFVPQENVKPIEIKRFGFISLPKENHRPLLKATISYDGRKIVLLCFHVISPQHPEAIAHQRTELEALGDWGQRTLKNSSQDLIVIGDFNSTPWYSLFRQILNKSGLKNSQRGFGIQTTWHSILPPILRIPIDHCLHSKSLTTINRSVGSNIGSDHLPLFVELKLN